MHFPAAVSLNSPTQQFITARLSTPFGGGVARGCLSLLLHPRKLIDTRTDPCTFRSETKKEGKTTQLAFWGNVATHSEWKSKANGKWEIHLQRARTVKSLRSSNQNPEYCIRRRLSFAAEPSTCSYKINYLWLLSTSCGSGSAVCMHWKSSWKSATPPHPIRLAKQRPPLKDGSAHPLAAFKAPAAENGPKKKPHSDSGA